MKLFCDLRNINTFKHLRVHYINVLNTYRNVHRGRKLLRVSNTEPRGRKLCAALVVNFKRAVILLMVLQMVISLVYRNDSEQTCNTSLNIDGTQI